jgi:acyl-CoA synthetase (NDP forming)
MGMEVSELISVAIREGRTSLNEAESKEVLRHYGVPVVEEFVVMDTEEAVAKAASVGFPVVLKGLGARLTHKTERGLVRLDLKDADDVRRAAMGIAESAGSDLEGFIVYHMLSGRREFVAGLFRDDQFGPVVMFGLGGIMTEALGDVVFRIAPLDEIHANAMMEELRSVRLLGSFRGEEAIYREQMVRVLVGLSRLGMEHPEVREVDINPLLVGRDGMVTAVDALVVLHEITLTPSMNPPVEPKEIGRLFYPRSIAFIGASAVFGKWGYTLFTNVLAGNFKGNIYLVNQKGGDIAGMPVFTSVTEIPDPVDLAVVMVPAEKVPALIPQFKAKGIKYVLLVTSGFSETGAIGRRLEQRLVEEARTAGIIILGPNTMGICNPHESLYCTYQHVRPNPGSTTLISQSGNLGTQLLAFAEREGVGIRAFAGSGNEAMITIEDYLGGLEHDDLTKTVVLYLESVKDGRRFFETARRVARKKPVIMLKGGRTQAGNRAAASHTGAMASNHVIFETACRQAGVVLGKTSMDLLDLSAAFSSLPLPAGNRVAIMTLGGGWGVVTADLCVEHGLSVPQLSPGITSQIDQVLPPYWSHTNPVDLVAEMDLSIPMMLSEALIRWDGCDVLIHLGILGRKTFVERMIESAFVVDPHCDRAFLEEIPRRLLEFDAAYTEHVVGLMEKFGKPVLGVRLLADESSRTVTSVEGHPHKGVAFPTPERAVKALAAMYSYRRWLDMEGS